ncbi:MAG: prepilin peptidase [Deltaproteobacteria bacterium]|nr:prepilin peptidase [Deltaproteobacteria bacterium]
MLGYMTLSTIRNALTHPVSGMMIVTGLILGSFFNVCIERIPNNNFFKSPRSICPHCGHLIPWWLNIPLISFFFLKGRAACCQKKISIQYPLVELAGAILFLLTYWKHPFLSGVPGHYIVNLNALIRFSHLSIFASLMLICSVIDIRHQIIPDKISLPMLLLSPLWVWLHPELDWKSSLIGALTGAGIIYGVAWAYYLLRKEQGIGMGDAKLLAAIGGWLGYQAVFPALFLGSVLGSAYGISAMIVSGRIGLKSRIPFGPFLAIGAILHMYVRTSLTELFLFR